MALKIVNDIPYVSASRIKMWEKCKHQFYLAYILPHLNTETELIVDEIEKPIGVEDVIHFTFGTIVHGAIEDFWSGKGRKLKDLLAHYEEWFTKMALADKWYYELGIEILEDYFDYLIFDAPKRKLIAQELEIDFYIGDARVKGRIDSIFYRGNGVYEIVDYKTNSFLPSQEDVDSDIQMGIYDIAFREDPKMKQYWVDGKKPKAILLTMHFLRHHPMYTEYSAVERKWNKKYIQVIHKQMQILRAEQFFATLNRFCGWCSVSPQCSAFQDALTNDSLDFMEEYDTEDFADKMMAIDEIQSRIKILNGELDEINHSLVEAFKDKVGADDTFVVGDKEYFLTQSSRRNINMNSAIRILEKADLWDPMKLINNLPLNKVQEMTRGHEDVWFKIERKAMYKTSGNVLLKSRKARK